MLTVAHLAVKIGSREGVQVQPRNHFVRCEELSEKGVHGCFFRRIFWVKIFLDFHLVVFIDQFRLLPNQLFPRAGLWWVRACRGAVRMSNRSCLHRRGSSQKRHRLRE